MKASARAMFLAAHFAAVLASRQQGTNPVAKVLELLSGLQQKIIKEGETATKVYDEFAEWCEDRSREIRFSIKTSQAQEEDLKAVIEKTTDEMDSRSTKIEELSSAISTDESDVKAITLLREKEVADFDKAQKDLVDTIDIIERAIAILEREAKGGTSLAQLEGVSSLSQALSVMVDASALSGADTARLTALVQSATASAEGTEEDSELGAPDPQTYGSHTGSIIETMEGLLDKAEAQLEDTRKTEATKKTNYELMKQSLEDKLNTAKRDMDTAKKELAEAGEEKATAEGDLSMTRKDLKESDTELSELHHNCMSKAADFEEEMKSRNEEITAINKAKQVIKDMTAGAVEVTYGPSEPEAEPTFLQMEADSDSSESADLKAVRLVKRLARKQNSPVLAQLSLRLDSALRSAVASGADPFEKVKVLISDMIDKLLDAASAETSHKLWCDREMAETKSKRKSKEVEIEKLTTKIDQISAESTILTEEVAELQKELAQLASSQASMFKVREEEHALYVKSKQEMEDGIKAVKMALKTLRDYFAKTDEAAHEAKADTGNAIISILQVVESDFSKGLSEMIAEEEAAQKLYEEQSKENEVSRTMKDADRKYKTKNIKESEKANAELTADLDGARTELEAVSEYFAKLQGQCVAKAEPFEERMQRKQQEIAGLKEALQILGGEVSLLEVGAAHSATRHLRSVRAHLDE
mmetsp:Transcript_15606/g.43136  ORF Transcript_15606/g.43136 Transcript_15606/m.43136 type:complete len:702 (-) Transcript_15606:69-2174(-)